MAELWMETDVEKARTYAAPPKVRMYAAQEFAIASPVEATSLMHKLEQSPSKPLLASAFTAGEISIILQQGRFVLAEKLGVRGLTLDDLALLYVVDSFALLLWQVGRTEPLQQSINAGSMPSVSQSISTARQAAAAAAIAAASQRQIDFMPMQMPRAHRVRAPRLRRQRAQIPHSDPVLVLDLRPGRLDLDAYYKAQRKWWGAFTNGGNKGTRMGLRDANRKLERLVETTNSTPGIRPRARLLLNQEFARVRADLASMPQIGSFQRQQIDDFTIDRVFRAIFYLIFFGAILAATCAMLYGIFHLIMM